jgi:hypothetical protein
MEETDAPAELRAAVEVTFLGGRTLGGRLRRFDPGLPDFTLVPGSESAARRVPFAEVRALTFLDAVDEGRAAEAREVTVRFFDSAELRGLLESAQQPGRGIFLRTLGGSTARRVFVPLAAVRDVVAVTALGALLIEQGKATPRMVEVALARQAELRRAPLGGILVDRAAVTQPQLHEALAAQQRRPGQRIGEVLIDLGFLGRDALQAALEVQRLLRGRRLGELLTEMGFVDQRTVYIALAIQHCMPFLDASSLAPDAEARPLLPAAFARRFRVLPLSREPDLVRVAVSDAGNLALRDELRNMLRVAVRDVLVLPEPLAAAIEAAYPSPVGA